MLFPASDEARGLEDCLAVLARNTSAFALAGPESLGSQSFAAQSQPQSQAAPNMVRAQGSTPI